MLWKCSSLPHPVKCWKKFLFFQIALSLLEFLLIDMNEKRISSIIFNAKMCHIWCFLLNSCWICGFQVCQTWTTNSIQWKKKNIDEDSLYERKKNMMATAFSLCCMPWLERNIKILSVLNRPDDVISMLNSRCCRSAVLLSRIHGAHMSARLYMFLGTVVEWNVPHCT